VAPAQAAARPWVVDKLAPLWLRWSHSPAGSTPWPTSWTRLAPARWSGRQLALVRGAGPAGTSKAFQSRHWARSVARLVQVSAQPAPVRTGWGWRARPRLERLPVDGSEGRPLPLLEPFGCVYRLSVGRENVTVSPVYRRPVTGWRCIRPGPPRVRLA